MTLFTTGEVSKMTGLTKRSIRYYSNLDLLKAKKNDKGQLVLLKSDLEKIVQILAAKMTGYKLKDLIERQPSLVVIKNDISQMIADLENVLFHLELVASEENLIKNIKLLQNYNTRYLRKRGD
ncbi:MerR family transcriptional regulator [Virgibacillus pantothenticus]|uniref:MerR family transcriptional regulator n=1 Tax=Virgibacillus pantothenticus TaxID=1473 RepID=UPI0028157575|nr:MerR family transcriptional regulator [Virgibacillus pantothenticus]MEB5454311.1 MerR family transcriptional regulator [Virgibacillus pantothenticus]MEB5458543.1 MerR family transcriptional regulator [Virgibacillus pantothenticus]MEB5466903.1 MerR family transcriptional regulator [Virgibacillus pantothenticus]